MANPIRYPTNSRPTDTPIGVVLALAVHAVLIFGLVTVFQWKTESETLYAELWAPEDITGTEQTGKAPVAPKAEPETKPEPESKSEPEQETPQPQTEPQPPKPSELEEVLRAQEAEIRLAQEKKREQEARKRLEEEQRRREEIERARERERERELALEKKREAERKAQEEKQRLAKLRALELKAEQARRNEAKLAQEMRQAELARIMGAKKVSTETAGSVRGTPGTLEQNLTGTANARYTARVIACIRPHIIYQVPGGTKRGLYQARYSIDLLPDGSQRAVHKIKASGLPAYDAAVERAIRQCNPMPRAVPPSSMPRSVNITFDPVDKS